MHNGLVQSTLESLLALASNEQKADLESRLEEVQSVVREAANESFQVDQKVNGRCVDAGPELAWVDDTEDLVVELEGWRRQVRISTSFEKC